MIPVTGTTKKIPSTRRGIVAVAARVSSRRMGVTG
jgi:hypothetical protein